MKKLIPKYQEGNKLKGFSDAYNFVSSYYRSPGFIKRFKGLKWANGFAGSKYDSNKLDNRIKHTFVANKKLNFKDVQYINSSIPGHAKYIKEELDNIFDREYPNGIIKVGNVSFPQYYASGYDDVIAHELGHALDRSILHYYMEPDFDTARYETQHPYSEAIPILRKNKRYISELNKLLSELNSSDQEFNEQYPVFIEHDAQPLESYADLVELRYILNKLGIYDSRKSNNPFTKEHLNKLKLLKPKSRILDNFSDKDIIWMINNVASNINNNETINS